MHESERESSGLPEQAPTATVGEAGEAAVAVSIEAAASINFAMQQNDVPVVRSVRVENRTDRTLTDVRLTVAASRPIFGPVELRLDSLAPGVARRFEPVDVVLDAQVLCNQAERERLQITAEVASGDRALRRITQPLELLAFNEWHGADGLAELIAAFVTPNHPSVEAVVAEARNALSRVTGDPSLSGYQSGSIDRVMRMVQAAALAFRAREIGYVNPPASFERTGQKVRSVDQVLDGRLGTCLDLVTALASVLEQIGLHPLIVLLKEHAILGVWLREERFPNTVVDDRATVAKRVQLGDIVIVETTALVGGSRVDFKGAREAAQRRLDRDDGFVCAVDVAACRRERIRPLPSRLSSGAGFQVVPAEPSSTPEPSLLDRFVEPATSRPTSRRPRRAPASEAVDLPPEASERLDRWKRKLLDLSLRNRLLNARETKRVVPLSVPHLPVFEDLLAEGKRFTVQSKPETLKGARDLSVEARRSGEDGENQLLSRFLADGRVCSQLPPGELATRLLQIYREARTSLEESGASTLYLALGSLVWYEAEASDVGHIAPLVLVPVTIQRNVTGGVYTLERADEDVRVNVTLLEKLRADFGIDGSHLERLEQDESGYDIQKTINGFVELVKDVPKWEIRSDAVLSLFSFAKFVMWADLEMRSAQIASNKVVRRLLDRSGGGGVLADIEPIDEPDRPSPRGGPVPAVDADSSQLAAMHAAMRGRTFVLQGPPGTGKSQTITNILASAIASGKRVLFVAEKMAALSVVKSRLQRLGLGPYCLEVHSSKSGKKEIVAQLQEALDAAGEPEPAEWAQSVSQVESAREELNGYVRALHTVRASGETAYSVIGRYTQLAGAPKVKLSIAQPEHVDCERLKAMRAAVRTLSQAARASGGLADHPLRGLRVRSWRLGLDTEIRDGAEQLRLSAVGLQAEVCAALSCLGVGASDAAARVSKVELDWLRRTVSRLLKGSAPTEALLREPGWEALKTAVVEEIRVGRAGDQALETLRTRYRESLLASDLSAMNARATAAAGSPWPMGWFRRRAVLASLRAHALDPKSTIADPAEDIRLANEVVTARAKWSAHDSAVRRLFGPRWAEQSRWDAMSRAVEWAGGVREQLAARPSGGVLDDRVVDGLVRLATDAERMAAGSAPRRTLEKLVVAERGFVASCTALEQVAGLKWSEIAGVRDPGFLDTVAAAAARWADSTDRLSDWCEWRDASALDGLPELAPIASEMASGRLRPSEAEVAFERAFAEAWLTGVFKEDSTLGRFSLTRHTQTLAAFRASDEALVRLGGSVVRARRREAAPPPSLSQANPNSELGVLKWQLALQRRHMPVRKLVAKLPNLLPRLKPCWLMSPMSVAQYLDPALKPFDLVVFDEASQIPPWDAVGALARGTEAVIVGDSKQLPPTNFFAKMETGEADNESDFDELESVLDEAVSSNLPTLSLLWHYRSRHESLIAFSNHHYYKNRLLTFPSPEASVAGLGVSMVFLPNARYDKGGARTNRLEAEAVVAEVVRRLQAAGERPASIGVVTFSVAQQYLVEDLLDVERRKHPEIERFFASGADEPVFIKNLENVQGDERDVIFFSICYGPHGDGQVSMNFGPINREGGERRLNVAITRARRELVVFSSLRPEQIDLSRTRAVGAAHLRSFLDYAERGPRAILEAASPGQATESPFEEAVREALLRRGHLVDVQVGCSGYRIDLAVKDPSCPGRYILGIECDGAAYHSSKAARDRDRLREQVLRGLGWRIHRVWSTDWLKSPSAALNRIERAIEEAAAIDTTEARPVVADPSSSVSGQARSVEELPLGDQPLPRSTEVQPDTLRGLEEYVCAKLPKARRDAERFRNGSAARLAASDVKAVVVVESPVHIERVASIISDAWGVERMSPRAREAFDDAIERAVESGEIRRDGAFLWVLPETGSGVQCFRVPTQGGQGLRPIDHVHPAEIAVAARAVLERQFSMPIQALCAEIGRLFGMQRTGAKVEAALRRGVELLARQGGCRIDGDAVSIDGSTWGS